MTVLNTQARFQYDGDGVSASFGFPVPFFEAAEIGVSVWDTIGEAEQSSVLNGMGAFDYTVTGAADPISGEYPSGTVIFNTAIGGAFRVTLYRNKDPIQNIDLTRNGPFPSDTINTGFDAAMMVALQLYDMLKRSMVAPVSDELDVDMALPAAAARAGFLLSFDQDGAPALGPSVTTLQQILIYAGITPSPAGFALNVTAPLFGAKGDSNPATHDDVAINAATLAAYNLSSGQSTIGVMIPDAPAQSNGKPGFYNCMAQINSYWNSHIFGAGSSTTHLHFPNDTHGLGPALAPASTRFAKVNDLYLTGNAPNSASAFKAAGINAWDSVYCTFRDIYIEDFVDGAVTSDASGPVTFDNVIVYGSLWGNTVNLYPRYGFRGTDGPGLGKAQAIYLKSCQVWFQTLADGGGSWAGDGSTVQYDWGPTHHQPGSSGDPRFSSSWGGGGKGGIWGASGIKVYVKASSVLTKKVQGGTVVTNATTAGGNNVLHFASVPSWIAAGLPVKDGSASVVPAGATVLSKTSTTVTISANATGGGVGNGDTIQFGDYQLFNTDSGAVFIAPGAVNVGARSIRVTFFTAPVNLAQVYLIWSDPTGQAGVQLDNSNLNTIDCEVSGAKIGFFDVLGNNYYGPTCATSQICDQLQQTALGAQPNTYDWTLQPNQTIDQNFSIVPGSMHAGITPGAGRDWQEAQRTTAYSNATTGFTQVTFDAGSTLSMFEMGGAGGPREVEFEGSYTLTRAAGGDAKADVQVSASYDNGGAWTVLRLVTLEANLGAGVPFTGMLKMAARDTKAMPPMIGQAQLILYKLEAKMDVGDSFALNGGGGGQFIALRARSMNPN